MEFRDLKKQYEVLKEDIDMNIAEVLTSARFISGPQIKELEERLADYVGVKHCITCANGTDAISLGLMALGVGIGDAVFVPDFTFFSSGECPAFAGATPIFVDVREDTYNIDLSSLENAIEKVMTDGKVLPKCVISVDLFGQPCEYEKLFEICKKYNLYLLEDSAQGFGGSISEGDKKIKRAGSFGDISTTSFFPAKPLGCYGDGGAVFTDNDEWAALIRSYAVHGKEGNNKYSNIRIGMNSRLDTIQAAILLPKFDAFVEYELENVNQVARWYNYELGECCVGLPRVLENYESSWAQYTVTLPEHMNRDTIQSRLKVQGIPTMVYYMKPMHEQGAFKNTYSSGFDCPITERLCNTVLSLPIHPYMTQNDVITVTGALIEALEENK